MWDANEGPPCFDLTCPCGWKLHWCMGPPWIADGKGSEVPGYCCENCGKKWRITLEVPVVAL